MKRKSLLLLLMLALCMPWAAKAADVVQIGGSTASHDHHAPLNLYYKSYMNQMIYTAEEIGMKGKITNIQFQYAYTDGVNSANFKVYMKHVSRNAFSSTTNWEDPSTMTLVFDGSVTMPTTAGNWVSISLATQFEYNGTDNLLICCYDNTIDSYNGSGNSDFYYTTTSGRNSVLYARSDSSVPTTSTTGTLTANRPNIKLTIDCTVTIGTGTSAERNPLDLWYRSYLTQQIYFPSEIGGAGRITSISFQYNYTDHVTTKPFNVYIGHVTKDRFSDSYDWVPLDQMTLVKSNVTVTTPSTAGEWITISSFSTPFDYNGVDNLVICCHDPDIANTYPGSSSSTFRCTTTTNNTVLRYSSDGTSASTSQSGSTSTYRPNLRVVLSHPYTSLAPVVTNYNNSYSQMIYTPAELGNPGACMINTIGFKSQASNLYARNITVYMAMTSKTGFSSNSDFIPFGNFTQVYSGTWNIQPGWNEFILSTPFYYDGASNLAVAVFSTASNYNYTGFYCEAAPNYQVIAAYNDNTAPNPSTYEGNWSSFDYKDYSKDLPKFMLLGVSCNESLPFSEDFENYADGETIEYCWGQEYVSGSTSWDIANASNNHGTGSKAARFFQDSDGDVTKLITPTINMSGHSAVRLQFTHTQEDWSGDLDNLKVYYRTSPTASWVQLAEYTDVITNPGNTETIMLPAAALTPACQIAFEGNSYYGYGVFVDDILIEDLADIPATVPYIENFDDEVVPWVFVNDGCTNKWYHGAAGAHDTGRGLYISSDNGATNSYNTGTISYVYAYRNITLPADTYELVFDHKQQGEGTWDCVGAMLYTSSTAPTTSTSYGSSGLINFPSGYSQFIVGVGKDFSNGSWNTSTTEFTIATAGTYKLAFCWKNDGGGGTQPPASIDNVKVRKKVNFYNITASASPSAGGNVKFLTGDGSSTNDSYLPCYSFYNNNLTQQIYTPEEIGNVGTINSIAFYNSGTTMTLTNFDVYIVHTDKTAFSSTTDWITVTASDLVYSGSQTMTAEQWNTVSFTTPFVYDGYSNVAIIIDEHMQYNSGLYCRVFTPASGGNCTLRVYSDGTDYNPMSPNGYTGTQMTVKNQILVNPGGSLTRAFPEGASCTLVAEPNETYHFVNWTENGNEVSTNEAYTISNITAAHTVVGNFAENTYTVTITASPTAGGTLAHTGGTWSGNTGTYNLGASATVTATAATGYDFISWTENGNVVSTNASYTISNISANHDLVANFRLKSFEVNISADPVEGGTVALIPANTSDVIVGTGTGTANTGPFNSGWEISFAETVYTTSAINSPAGYIYSLSYYVDHTESGSATSSHVAFYMKHVSRTTMSSYESVSASDLVFDGTWNIPTSGWTTITLDNPFYYDGTSNLMIACYESTAGKAPVFFTYTEVTDARISWANNSNSINPYNIGTTDGGPWTGNNRVNVKLGMDMGNYYVHGTSVTATATPETGYHFVNWTENGSQVSTDASYNFTVTANRNLVANFALDAHTITLAQNPSNSGTLTVTNNGSTVTTGSLVNQGDVLNISASPHNGYTFTSWTVEGAGASVADPTAASTTFTMGTADATLTANFTLNSYLVEVSADPTAGGTVTGGGSYNHGSTAIVTATANTGYTFEGWYENNTRVSTDASYSFNVQYAHTLVAHFTVNTYTITVNSNWPAGGSATGGGTFDYGTEITISATANTGFTFSRWSDGNTDNPRTVTVTQDATYVAEFTKNSYTITLVPGAGGNASGGGTYYYGDECTVTALPNTGYSFVSWTENGSVVSNDAEYTFTVTGPRTLDAYFTVNSYQVTVSADPAEGGAVTGGGTFNYGASCTVTTTVNPGYSFNGWIKNGTPVSTETSYTFTVEEATTMVANFQPDQTLTTYVNPLEGGWITADLASTIGTIEVGTGTGTASSTPYATGQAYSYQQCLYMASEINAPQGGCDITSISYQLKGNTNVQTNHIEVYMKHTDLTQFAGTSNSNFVEVVENDKVFDGDWYIPSVGSDPEWATIILSKPFHYDGTSNLMIGIHENTNQNATANFVFTTTTNYTRLNTYGSADPNPLDRNTFNGSGLSKARGKDRANVRFGFGTYHHGTNVTLTANANTDYMFNGWTVDGTPVEGNSNTYTVTMDDDHTVTANFISIVFTKEITGYGSGTGNWYLIASPLAASVSPGNVENMVATPAEHYDLFYFKQDATVDPGTNIGLEWINYKETAANGGGFSLANGTGYLYANYNDVTLTFRGAPYSGDGVVTLTNTTSYNWSGWNLVGNPFYYTAYIGSTPYYRMNAEGTEIVSVTPGTAIEPMEGVFVQYAAPGTVTFSATAPSKGASLALDITKDRGLVDRAIVNFGDEGTLSKFQLNPSHTKVYIPQDGIDYAVVAADGEAGEMPVSFKAERNGSYTIGVNAEGVRFSYLHLIDNMTGADVDLLSTPSYTFDARTTDYASRFKLVFATGNSDDDNFAFYSNGSFVISNDGEATLQVIDVLGRIVKSETLHGCASVSVNAAPGVYMLRLINGENEKVQKVVVR